MGLFVGSMGFETLETLEEGRGFESHEYIYIYRCMVYGAVNEGMERKGKGKEWNGIELVNHLSFISYSLALSIFTHV